MITDLVKAPGLLGVFWDKRLSPEMGIMADLGVRMNEVFLDEELLG